jgi:hypothetical protein
MNVPFSLLMLFMLAAFSAIIEGSPTPHTPNSSEPSSAVAFEIELLQSERQQLLQAAKRDRQLEMHDEIRGQPDIKAYAWGSFVKHLKDAEQHEEVAQHIDQRIAEIDRELEELYRTIQNSSK